MGDNMFILTTTLTIAQLLSISVVSADFCEWMICHPTEQYCCGDNICCNYYNYNTWYLWGVAVMIGLLLVALYYIFCSSACEGRDPEGDKVPIVIR